MDAYESFIKGRYFYYSFIEGGLEKALQHYKQAITLDPNYAPAYSAIAEWYWALPFIGQEASKEDIYTKAKEAVNKALEIDNNLPETHSNLGLIRWNYEWDWKTDSLLIIIVLVLALLLFGYLQLIFKILCL